MNERLNTVKMNLSERWRQFFFIHLSVPIAEFPFGFFFVLFFFFLGGERGGGGGGGLLLFSHLVY